MAAAARTRSGSAEWQTASSAVSPPAGPQEADRQGGPLPHLGRRVVPQKFQQPLSRLTDATRRQCVHGPGPHPLVRVGQAAQQKLGAALGRQLGQGVGHQEPDRWFRVPPEHIQHVE